MGHPALVYGIERTINPTPQTVADASVNPRSRLFVAFGEKYDDFTKFGLPVII